MNTPFNRQSLFITGTNTGVGKTTVTGALLLALQQRGHSVAVIKPIETGFDPNKKDQSDTGLLRSLVSTVPSWEEICLYPYETPLAPLACARHSGISIDFTRILDHWRRVSDEVSFVLIEGAGGLLAPLTPTQTTKDLIAELQVPCLVVGQTSLGAVNHSLLTIESLHKSGLSTRGIILNETTDPGESIGTWQQRTSTIELIREFAPVPVFGPVGYEKHIHQNWREGVGTLAGHPEMQRLVTTLCQRVP